VVVLPLQQDSYSVTITDQSNVGATEDSIEAPSCFVQPMAGVWYRFMIAFPSTITVSTCNQADFDTQTAIYSGSTCGSLICKAFADNTEGCGSSTTRVVDDVIMAADIYILVSGYLEIYWQF